MAVTRMSDTKTYGPMAANFSYIGLAADVKPTTDIAIGMTFYETDTQAAFVWGGGSWVLMSSTDDTAAEELTRLRRLAEIRQLQQMAQAFEELTSGEPRSLQSAAGYEIR